MAGPGFVHLHVHSAFSLLEGALPMGRLIDLALGDGQPALGIADTANLFGALEFSEKAAGKGIQPLIGCELPFDFADVEPGAQDRNRRGKNALVLMALDADGFANLSRLVSRAYMGGEGGGAVAGFDWLDDQSSAGLVCLTGGPEGAIDPLFANGQDALALKRLERLRNRFGDRLYIELQRHGRAQEARAEPQLVDFAYARGVPLVATNEPFFARRDDFEAHDALLAIAEGSVLAQTERRKLSEDHFFKSRADMLSLFADLPEALESTVEIARRTHFRPRTRDPILPTFAADPGLEPEEAVRAEADELTRQARAGLAARLKSDADLAPGFSRADYDERLTTELDIIARMKFPGYFLIVADFIKWAKAQDIPVGPGRGSGAGSLVAFALTITDLDPLRYNLLFERFLNPERVSMPDFDIDFCQDRREEVIAYVQNKYGSDQVAQIITFGTLQARAVLRDVGRVLQMPYGQVDRIAKLVPANPANPVTLAEAIAGEPHLRLMRDEDETVAELLDIGQKLEGLFRHASTHAAGIVIGDRPLQELVPLYRDPRSDMPVTQYNLKWVEPAGLVKFDFLGLKTLTVIDHAVRFIRRRVPDFAIETIPIDDELTYKLYQRGETAGVFQVEGQGMRRALVELKPDRFEDIIAMVALYRPGPMDNIPSFNARKHGREKPDYPDPRVEPILSETYGIIVYQEQVMQIAQVLSGYSLGEADVLRRAMGKKVKAEMDAQRARFVEGALARNITRNKAEAIFDLLAKFANYGFNKSHAAAYALVSYQTAYLKAHYPVEFLAASMTLDMGNTDKLADFNQEAKRLGIDVLPPCVNRSNVEFDVSEGRIHYALCAVKGVGRPVAEAIVGARGAGTFADLADFATRLDPRTVNRRALETLVNAGALDTLVDRREQAAAATEAIVATAQRAEANRTDGIADMFSADAPEPIRLAEGLEPWLPADRLERERAAIGFHLSGHPLDDFAPQFESLRIQRWLDFERAAREAGVGAGRLAGTVASRQDRKTRKGTPMAIVTFSDPSGMYECMLFSEQIGQFGEILSVGNAVMLEVAADNRPEGVRLRLIRAEMLGKATEKLAKRMTVFAADACCLAPIKAQLRPGGEGTVSLVVIRDKGLREYEIELPGSFRLTPELVGGIKALEGVTDARLA